MKIKKQNLRYFLLKNNLRNKSDLNQYSLSFNNNYEISMYKNFFNTYNKIKTNNNKYKSIPLLYLSNIKSKINEKAYQNNNCNNNISNISSSQNKLIINNDNNKNKYNNISSTTINNTPRYNIESIIKNFEQNKNSTKMLIEKEKSPKLNSLYNLNEKDIEFLLSEENCNSEGNNEYNSLINEKNNSYRLCSKLIKLFNNKTNEILNSSENSLKTFSKVKNRFSNDLINNFKKIQFNENDLKKLRKKYIEANEILEAINEQKIKRAKKLEKEFYKLKNEENFNKSELKPKKLLLNNLSISQKNILNIPKIEEKLNKAHMIYDKYIQKKIELNAKTFDININKLIYSKNQIKNNKYLDEQTKQIKILYKDILKYKEINKIKNKKKEDEYKNEYKKLKNKMNKCEDEYYRVCAFNNKNFKLSFLKPILKAKTNKKYLRIQDSNFGIP